MPSLSVKRSDRYSPYSIKTAQLDAVEWLRTLADESVNLVITDPPYESLEKYRKIGTTTRLKNSKASSNEWFQIFPDSRYPDLFSEIYRVLAKNSHFYMMCDETTLFVIKPIAEAAGFKFWKSIIWDKQCMGMGYHYRNRTERIAFFEKGKRKLNNLGIPDVLSVKRIIGGYPTEKPVELFDTLIQQSTSPGNKVADPFFGSGSVLISALKNECFALGNDISDGAHQHFSQRVQSIGGL